MGGWREKRRIEKMEEDRGSGSDGRREIGGEGKDLAEREGEGEGGGDLVVCCECIDDSMSRDSKKIAHNHNNNLN